MIGQALWTLFKIITGSIFFTWELFVPEDGMGHGLALVIMLSIFAVLAASAEE